MIRYEAFRLNRDDLPQWRHVAWKTFSWSVLALCCITRLALPEAVAQDNKGKARKSAAKSKEPAAKPNEKEIRGALSGNLCRCGTHNRIVRAIQRASGQKVTA